MSEKDQSLNFISNVLCLNYTWSSKKHNHAFKDMPDQFSFILMLVNVIYRWGFFKNNGLIHLEIYTLIEDEKAKSILNNTENVKK